MTEREIFLAILELPDEEARDRFLDRVCAEDASLRAGIEALLRSHDVAGSFLEEPVVDPLAAYVTPVDAKFDAAGGLGEHTTPHAVAGERRPIPERPGEQTSGTDEVSFLDFLQPASRPGSLGRLAHYEIESVLGKGGFGVVLRAYDERLQRRVAIKLPRPVLVSRPEAAELYLKEARTLARLDHPNIVPVYEIGSSPTSSCYIVSKLIEGRTLTERIKEAPPAREESIDLIATLAEALHYAHLQGLVHRDIKPDNIVLDTSGKAYLVDFGLALREEDFGQGPRYGGTLAYMSPEQAQGESHRVDGRSDIFSLGVVFYELLVGRRPFRADSKYDLLELIACVEPRPPRQLDDTLPRELERICLKALAKRASDRYTTANDLAEDLRQFQQQTVEERARSSTSSRLPVDNSAPGVAGKIIPKGLRSFDIHDTDFFLELLPGPRDRDGLPDSLRFWKRRIEETDPDHSFAVGLLYGPSGCGKSSLVKAGLLPRLSEAVLPVYVEATTDETETRLLTALRKRVSEGAAPRGLKETLTALRRGQGLTGGKKVLIVLDQFEQWLHGRRTGDGEAIGSPELVQALRQCDGRHVQCLILVRDDFWLAVSRFLRELEIRLVEGHNCAMVDLFDEDHARRILASFGRALGKLTTSLPREEHEGFLRQAVRGLAQEGKVISVRLALFAETMKGRPWTVAALSEVGGAEGVGITFLEETFSASKAPPAHRYHQEAARAVLRELLPQSGSDIKGHMRSQMELLSASGYARRPADFDELIRLLDGNLRLITPTDPAEIEQVSEERLSTEVPMLPDGEARRPPLRYYQLTHDYLVHPLREWLTRKQKETRRGRAELLLADCADVWHARREDRQLPSFSQWLTLRLLTSRSHWTPPQTQMMRQARRHHTLRGLLFGLLLVLIGWGSHEGHGRLKAQALKERLLDANTPEVSAIIDDMTPYRRWLDPLLHQTSQEPGIHQDPRKHLHTSLALLPVDSGQLSYLYGRLLNAAAHELPVLRTALAPHKEDLKDLLWGIIEQSPRGQEGQRLRAACALAEYDPESPRWEKLGGLVADEFVAQSPVFLGLWMEGFRPVRGKLLSPLTTIFRDPRRRESERSLATNILADYAADQPQVVADLLMDADEKAFAVLFPRLKPQGERGVLVLQAELDRQLPQETAEDAREVLAQRQANAAVALLRLGRPNQVWPLLQHTPEPRRRSYLIHRLSLLGAEPQSLVHRLKEEKDLTIRRALILSLGEFGESEWAPGEQAALIGALQEIFRGEPDAGLHGASEWLLRTWGQEPWLKEAKAEWRNGKGAPGAWPLARDEPRSASLPPGREKPASPGWYVNSQSQTMIVIPGPVEFLMGSPMTEPGRDRGEARHLRRIGRSFAIAQTHVTVEQFRSFQPQFTHNLMHRCPEPECPLVGVTWYEAAAYCNWLSEQDGLPKTEWCYEPNPKTGQYAEGMTLAKDYLSRTGYRLPTEAEWEYACRAGATTRRSYGHSDDLLEEYAWYTQNSRDRTWPVGRLKPNDLGLFDMHGHLYAWCQERETSYPIEANDKVFEDREESFQVSDREPRLLRGGSFNTTAPNIRSAWRYRYVPGDRGYLLGFRVARTVN